MNIVIEKDKVRLDQYLSEVLEISRSKVQKLIKDEKILINGVSVSPSFKGKIGDDVAILDDLDFEITLEGEDIPLDIVFEDNDFIILNKASGMVVHPAPGHYTGTLVNALLHHSALSTGSHQFRPGIVHRLDKDTSGLMMVAKNDLVHDKLSTMIKEKKVERKYTALVDGIILHETGTIDAPIGRDPQNPLRMKVTEINSRPSITHFRVLKRFESSNQTLIECKLETGRTHQIRAHLAYIGYPVYNDSVYGTKKGTTKFGQFLHSSSIFLIHPITKEEIRLTSELPSEFSEYLENLKATEEVVKKTN